MSRFKSLIQYVLLLCVIVMPAFAAQAGNGMQALVAPDDPIIASNGNTGGVQSGPTHSTAFGIKVPHRITFIFNYHYFNNGKPPGTIALKGEDGTIYGPWQAEGAAGQGKAPNAYWVVRPDVVLKPGLYIIIDSDPSSWSYNSQSKGSGFFEVRGVKQALQNVTQPGNDTSGLRKAPMPDSTLPQLIEAVKSLRLEIIAAPAATLKKYSSGTALQNFTDIENALFTETPSGVGWQYYFATATYTVRALPDKNYVVLFYHPWSDTAIMAQLQFRNNKLSIIKADLLLGDYIRQYGKPPFELQPLWERESATKTPLLAVPLAVGETLVAFENIFQNGVKPDSGSPFVNQRSNFDNNLKNSSIYKSLLAAANLRFERSITSLIRYEQDKKLEVYQEYTALLLNNIKNADFKELQATIPQTSQAAFDLIRSNYKEIALFKAVAVLKTPRDCFIALSHPADPNNVLLLWFQTSNDKYGLRQAHFLNHVFSASHLNQIRDLIEKVNQP